MAIQKASLKKVVKKPPMKSAPKVAPTPKEAKKAEGGKGEFAKYCEQLGVHPKVARAKLRRKGLKSGGSWQLTAEVKKALAAAD